MRILYVTTVSSTMGFFREQFKYLISIGYSIDIACNNNVPVENFVELDNIMVHDIPFSRRPLSIGNAKAYIQLKKIIEKNDYDVVHCHTPNASAIVRLACRKRRKDGLKIVYTAHGFHFFKSAPKKNWLVYYPIEKILSSFTDVLITINHEDYQIAKNKFKMKKLFYMPGMGIKKMVKDESGFNKEEFLHTLGIKSHDLILLSVGEVNKNKNHQLVVQALKRIKSQNIQYLICGSGNKEAYIRQLAKELGVDDRVHLLGYRKDVYNIYSISDIFVFPSLREGLGMAALEAMSCGLPIITSNVHGMNDYSINNVTGFKFNPYNVDEVVDAIIKLKDNDELRIKMGNYNAEHVKKYSQDNVFDILKTIYRQV